MVSPSSPQCILWFLVCYFLSWILCKGWLFISFKSLNISNLHLAVVAYLREAQWRPRHGGTPAEPLAPSLTQDCLIALLVHAAPLLGAHPLATLTAMGIPLPNPNWGVSLVGRSILRYIFLFHGSLIRLFHFLMSSSIRSPSDLFLCALNSKLNHTLTRPCFPFWFIHF